MVVVVFDFYGGKTQASQRTIRKSYFIQEIVNFDSSLMMDHYK